MKSLSQTNQFAKDLKRLKKRKKDFSKLEEVVKRLAQGLALDAKHQDHPLQGDWKGSRDCHIENDWVLIYTFGEDSLRLERTGTHADLFE